MWSHIFLLLLGCAAAQRVENLTVGSLRTPALGVDVYYTPKPLFGWQTSAPQVAFRVVVADSLSQAPMWDSGRVASLQPRAVYAGATALGYDADYTLTVSVYFDSSSSAVQAVGAFSTGLDSAAWAGSAAWVGSCTAAQQSPQLRTAFSLSPAPILRARAYVSAVGLFTLHLNGGRVGGGRDVLTPGWSTVPSVRVLADTFDIAADLRAGGENVVGMRLGQGKYGYVYEFCHAGDATCFAGVLHISILQQGGNETVIQSGPGWTCAPSPIVFQHLFHGESYNATLEQVGWDSPGFSPPQPWAPAPIVRPNVTLLSTGVPPIRTAADVAPKNISGGAGVPVVSGGKFVIGSSSPDVFWWADNTTVKNFVQYCVRLPPPPFFAAVTPHCLKPC